MGGIYITHGIAPPQVELAEAVEGVLALHEGFDFQTPSDKSRALAMMLSPALKAGHTLDARVPIDVAEADQSQAGKGKRQNIIAAVYGETPRLVMNKVGGVGSMDEELASALVEGRTFIQIDTVRGKIDSQFLESVLTSSDLKGGDVPCRTPHKPTVKVETRPYNFMLTSNGMESTKDLANRSCISRIRKRPEGFEFTTYKEGNILRHVEANQGYYLGCAFAIVAEWIKLGKPTTNERRHDFQEWAASLDWIVQNIMGLAPLMDGHKAAAERTSNPALTWLRSVALALAQDGELDKPLTASNIVEVCETAGINVPGMRKDTAAENAKKLVGLTMARLFKDKPDTIEIDGYTVLRAEDSQFCDSRSGYNPVKAYTFSRPA